MVNSCLAIFSIFKNVKEFLDKDCDISLYKMKSKMWYDRSSKYMKPYYKKIYNDIENSFYSIDDLIIFLLHESLMGKKLNIKNVKRDCVVDLKKKLSINTLSLDKKIILHVLKETKVNIRFLLEERNGGCLLCDELIKKDKVSVIYFILDESY
jgi:hypothetical protein